MSNVGGIRAGRAYVELYADLTKLQQSLKLAESKLKAFGDSAASIGGQFLGVGVAASTPIALAVKNYADFDDQMRATQAVSGATGKELELLTERAKELGRTTSFTAAQVASGMVELGRAGFKTPEIDASIANVMNLSRATQTEIPLATEIAGNALRSFGLDASEMGRVCDVLTATANNSSQTLEDLGEAFKFVAPIAADAGLSIEDASKIVGTLANFGIKGSLAGTAFKNIQLKMADPAVQKSYEALGVAVIDADGSLRNMSDVLRDLGAATASMPNAEKLATYKDLFGMYGLSGGIKLSSANFQGMYDAIDNAQGTAARVAEEMDKGIGGSFRLTASAIEGVSHAIGEALTPTLTELMNSVMQVAGETTAWIKENEGAVVAVAQIAAGLTVGGGALLAFGTAAKLVAGAFTGVRAASAAYTRTLAALGGAIKTSSAAMVGAARAPATAVASSVASVAKTTASAASGLARVAASSVVSATKATVATVAHKGLAKSLYDVGAAGLAATKNGVGGVWGALKEAAFRAATAIKAFGTTLWSASKAGVAASISATKTAAANAIGTARTVAATVATRGWKGSLYDAAKAASATTVAATKAGVAAAASATRAAASAVSFRGFGAACRFAGGAAASLAVALGPLTIISAVAYATHQFATASTRATEAAREATSAAQEQAAANATLRDRHSEMFDRLVELSEKSNLTNAEFAEGCEIAKQLQGAYGDLGITVDQTAKKFGGLTEAAQRFAMAKIQQEIADKQLQLQKLDNENKEISREFVSLGGLGGFTRFLGGAVGLTDSREERHEQLATRRGEIQAETRNVNNSIALLQAQLTGMQRDAALRAQQGAAPTLASSATPQKSEDETQKELEDAQATAAKFENAALSDADRKRAEINKQYDDYVAALATIRDEGIASGDVEATNKYRVAIANADAWKTAQLADVDAEVAADKREEAEKNRRDERSRRDASASAEVTKARFAVLQAMNGGGNVSAATSALRAAEAEFEKTRQTNAQADASAAMERFAAAQKELKEAEKSG
ncbi:MAG: phage tail tape measure protein, partial [Thermoguttaceae bacterium]|nr:phage tail tape measure protein [Thermoguttaceae bacterium]